MIIYNYLGVFQYSSLCEWTEDNTGNRNAQEEVSYIFLKEQVNLYSD